jgi:allantoate deiminase
MTALARTVIDTCREIAHCSEEPGRITRTFLSPPMRDVHRLLSQWMERMGMSVRVDAAGNLRGLTRPSAPRLVIGSHLDTVPNAGAYDGILGVVIGIALAEIIGRDDRLALEVIGFSEEEGVQMLKSGIGQAIREYGLNPDQLADARLAPEAAAYLEIHIEQGPVLDELGFPLGIVERIMGQSRLSLTFRGQANHAGTTPLALRRDALAGAAEFILSVESTASRDAELRATVGAIQVEPNAGNVIAGSARVSLDVRHGCDDRRHIEVAALLERARTIAESRNLSVETTTLLDQAVVPLDRSLTDRLAEAVAWSAYPVHRMASGAGHDAMILAPHVPSTMLFLRSPGGLSHHPDESVIPDDVDAALAVGTKFIQSLGAACV